MLDPSILVGHGTSPIQSVQVTDGSSFPAALVTDSGQVIDRDQSKRIQEAEQVGKTLASVVELQSSLDRSTNLIEAGDLVTKSIRKHLSASLVVLLWRRRPAASLTIIADSADEVMSKDDVQSVIAAAEEIAARDSLTQWPPLDPVGRHSLLAVAQMAQQISVQSVTATRLVDHSAGERGVILVMDASNCPSDQFLCVVSAPLAGSLHRIDLNQPSRIENAIRLGMKFTRGRRRGLCLTGLVLLTLLMLMPMRYHIPAKLELQPVQRRYVAVPIDGPLEKAYVRPGDLVRQGDLLATMDAREINFQLAGNQAKWNQAEQERKTAMVDHDFAGSKLAALETERLRLQSELLTHQRDSAEIRSPIAGVVVSGDASHSEGMPMTRGETLLEIAPLGKMMVEVAIPEADVSEVRPGMKLNFYVHAFPNRRIDGVIKRLHPKAESRDNDNVFIAEVLLDDPDQVFRPGMQGRASVIGDRHPLGWNLFHRSYFAVRHAIGW